MRFRLVDAILEHSDDRVVAVKHVSSAEEYLQDHFPAFPILPGVMMLEALVQAGRILAERRRGGASGAPWVLGAVRALKYGRFVQPGDSLRVEVSVLREGEDGAFDLRGEGIVIGPGAPEEQTAVQGRFSLRPARVGPGAA